MDKLAAAVIEREQRLRSARSAEEHTWKEAYEFLLPTKSTFTYNVSSGVTREADLLDSTGARALEQFAAFLFSTLNNPASKWVRVKPVGPKATKAFLLRQDVKLAIEETEELIADFLTNSVRVYEMLHETYLNLGVTGNGTTAQELVDEGLRAWCPHPVDVVFELDRFFRPGPHFVQAWLTPEQLYARYGAEALYGENEPVGDDEEVRKRRAQDKMIRVLDVDIPRNPDMYSLSEFLGDNDKAAFGWVNFVVNTETKRVVSKFIKTNTPKFNTGRWLVPPGGTLGRGPGITSLPDNRMANRMSATIVRAGEKVVDPPWAVYNGSLVSPLRLFSGGITHIEGDRKPEPLLAPGSSRVDITDALLAAKQMAIREAFAAPLFMTPDSPVKSATEVLQQVDERNRSVAPMLIRVQEEVLRRVVARALDLGDASGALGDTPQALQGVPLRFQYADPLRASQAQTEALGTSRLFELLMPWAQVDIGVLDMFDPDKVAAVAHRGSGAPAHIERTETEVKAIRKERAEAAARAEAMAAAKDVAIPAAAVAAQSKSGK